MSSDDRNRDSLMEEYGIEPYTLVTDIMKNIVFIVIGAIAVMLLVCVFESYRYEPRYKTNTTFVVSNKEYNGSYDNLSSTRKMALTMEKILCSTIMEKKICEELGIEVEDFDAEIASKTIEGTNLLELSVIANNPKESIDIIRTIMENYSSISLFTVGNASLDVLQPAVIPQYPENPLAIKSIAKKAFLLGMLIWIALFGWCSHMANTIKQERDIERKLDAKSYGVIPFEKKKKTLRSLLGKKNKKALLVDDPMCGFAFVENYKKLVSKIEYNMSRNGKKILVVTSVSENEGKSTVAANIALTLAGQGNTVVLLDGDIRRPSQFLVLGMEMEDGQEIGEYLQGKTTMNSILKKTKRKGLFFIGGKGCYSTSTEMLNTQRLPDLMRKLKQVADYVVIDTPPAGLIGDSQVFAHYADGVLLVTKQNMVLAEDINDVIDDFVDSHNEVLGVVLNGVHSAKSLKITQYGNYRHYGRYYKATNSKGK